LTLTLTLTFACRYVIYVNEHRARVKEANPELTFPAISKVLGAEWSALDIVEKQVFINSIYVAPNPLLLNIYVQTDIVEKQVFINSIYVAPSPINSH
jgi:hypothetical protein